MRRLGGALAMALLVAGCAVRVPRTVGVAIPGPAGKLEGSLFLPDGRGPHPAVVLIHTARENSRLDYLQEARYFATHGVAALAYDKRGTGGSAGDLGAANFAFLAQDAEAAARFLRARTEIDSSRVGYWGMGQGGWVAPLAAARDTTAAFVVLVSAPIVTPLEQTMVQRTEELAAKGLDKGTAEAIARLRRRIWDYWLSPLGSGTAVSDSLHQAFRRAATRPWFPGAVVSHDLPESLIVDEGMGPEEHPARWWFKGDMPTFWSLRHEPVGVLMRVRAPILAVYGDQDRVVPVVESVVNFQAALGRAYNHRGVVRTFRGADHAMLVRRGAGLFTKIEPAPGYRDTVMAWLGRTVR
ncbi:MAG TPA: alpha/beta hydrolase [Candidatus Eisenbacteria bacterium]|nr:alpha/beta hydrolase [Candidatus Eisenbacteria bacterium]